MSPARSPQDSPSTASDDAASASFDFRELGHHRESDATLCPSFGSGADPRAPPDPFATPVSRMRSFGDLESNRPRKAFGSRKLGTQSPASFASQESGDRRVGGPRRDPMTVRKESYQQKVERIRQQSRDIIENFVESKSRQVFLIWLAKALLYFGAPSHRIESQLNSAAVILKVNVGFIHLPNLILVTFLDSETHTYETRFVRAGGRISLTSLHKIHLIYRDVLRDKTRACDGSKMIRKILRSPPLYPTWMRCLLAFSCASIICTTAFGGSFIDMFISGASASSLQYLGLRAASKSPIYANVYEISVAIIVSFLARALGTLQSNLFCYSSISSAGVVLILPGFTILISALELTSKNILCGSVRMVYAIIYTLFLGFSLTIGSDLYLVTNKHARNSMAHASYQVSQFAHGGLLSSNDTMNFAPVVGTFEFITIAPGGSMIKGCYRNFSWPWFRLPFPWWTLFFLVPIYSFCSSLANLQTWRSVQLPIMVLFSCLAYAANRGANELISNRSDIVSAFGALVIGLCGNVYSRVVGGTAFTSMVTGVLFLVPSAIGNGGGLIQNYQTSTQEYTSGFSLGVRMIQVGIGVTVGLFIAQIIVYTLGRRKNAAYFAF